MRIGLLAVVALGVASHAGLARAEDWPQFRGPSAAGRSTSSQAPSEWSDEKDGAEKNIAWKIEVPGVAWSQPIVWGDNIFVTTAITENQQKPAGGGFGGGGGGEGRGGFGPPGGGRPPRGEQAERRDKGAPRPEGGQRRPGGQRPPGGPGGFGGGFGRPSAPPDAVYQWKVLCLDRQSGKTLWEQLAKQAKPTIPTHRTNTFASETPVTDGERLYAYFGMTGLYCYDLEGKLLWSKDLGTYPMMAGWGTGSSPALEGDRLFILCDNEEQSFLAAFDKKSGDELWRVKRDEKSNWCTPFVWKNKLRTELVISGATTRSYDPASGKLLWEMGGNAGGARSSPTADDELLYVGTGGGMGGAGPLSAIRAGADGDITPMGSETTSAGVAWSVGRSGPPMASPLLYEGCLYVADQRSGVVACYDAKTGEQHYKERLPSARGFTSSPWAADGKVFCLDESGQTFVLQPGPELKILATNKLDDMFWSSAALAGDQLLLRGVSRLYCITEKE
ncbi:MAG: PQQ-binding-like beta-propeller repeat protein [Pirellulaceae bacterium]